MREIEFEIYHEQWEKEKKLRKLAETGKAIQRFKFLICTRHTRRGSYDSRSLIPKGGLCLAVGSVLVE